MSSQKFYFIGNKGDYEDFKNNTTDINNLPVKNLPMSYFPFFYNTSESSIEKLRKLVPLFETYTKTSISSDTSQPANNTIDTEKLFGLLSQLEESYQPFNQNNVKHIFMMIIFLWMIVLLFVLKIFSALLGVYYTYFILGLIGLLSVIGVIWSFFITNTVL